MPTTNMTQINTAIPQDDLDWLSAEGKRLGVTRSEMVRQAIAYFRSNAPADPTPTTQTEDPTKMPRPRRKSDWNKTPGVLQPKKGRFTADNPLPDDQKVRPLRVTCPGCSREQWATEDGQPRPHLRAATEDDPDWSPLVPVRVECDGTVQPLESPVRGTP